MAEKKKFAESLSGGLEKLHIGLGAAALAGAFIFPPAEAPLVMVAAWEFGHAALWNFLKNKSKGSPKPAT